MKRVHLVKERTLEKFANENPGFRSAASQFLDRLKEAGWSEPADIKKDFSAADLLGNGSMRVIFDLGGNKFRMICSYYFGFNSVKLYICWIGNHRDYDELCRKGLQYTISLY